MANVFIALDFAEKSVQDSLIRLLFVIIAGFVVIIIEIMIYCDCY